MFLSLSIKICRCKRGRHRPNGSKAFAVQSNGNMCQRGEILTLSKIWANHWVTLLNCWEVFEMMSKNFPNRQCKLPQNWVKHKNKERKKERKHGSTNLKKIEMDHNNMVLFENLSAYNSFQSSFLLFVTIDIMFMCLTQSIDFVTYK